RRHHQGREEAVQRLQVEAAEGHGPLFQQVGKTGDLRVVEIGRRRGHGGQPQSWGLHGSPLRGRRRVGTADRPGGALAYNARFPRKPSRPCPSSPATPPSPGASKSVPASGCPTWTRARATGKWW